MLAVRELTLRAVPIWLLRQYLEQLGATEIEPPAPGPTDPDAVVRPDAAMSGDGWTVMWRTEQRPMHPRLPTMMDEHYFVFTGRIGGGAGGADRPVHDEGAARRRLNLRPIMAADGD